MPRFALLDADGVVTNVVALGRREDITHVLDHVRDGEGEIELREDGAPVLTAVPTDEHLLAHGAVSIVEADASVRVGMVRQEDGFAWPSDPALPGSVSAPSTPTPLDAAK